MDTGGSQLIPPSVLLLLTKFFFPQVATITPFLVTTKLGNRSPVKSICFSKKEIFLSSFEISTSVFDEKLCENKTNKMSAEFFKLKKI